MIDEAVAGLVRGLVEDLTQHYDERLASLEDEVARLQNRTYDLEARFTDQALRD